MHARHPEIAQRFEEHTPAGAKLPERANRKQVVRQLRERMGRHGHRRSH